MAFKDPRMDYWNSLKHALYIAIRFRPLWFFGILLALCGGSGFDRGMPGSVGVFAGQLPFELTPTIGIVFVCTSLIMMVGTLFIRFCCLSALIGLVNQLEMSGAMTFSHGVRTGLSKKALHLFLISTLIVIPITVTLSLMGIIGVLPFLLLGAASRIWQIVGLVSGAGFTLLWCGGSVLVTLLTSGLLAFAHRFAVLQNKRPIGSLIASYKLMQHNFKQTLAILFLLWGIAIVWSLTLVLLLVAVVVVPGILTYWIVDQISITLIISGLLFIFAYAIPLTVVQSSYLSFRSSVWTLAFRKLIAAPRALIAETSIDPRGRPINAPGQ